MFCPPTLPTILPVGKGKALGSNMNSVLNAVVGGWQASTIISIHSGFPLAVYNASRHLGNEWTRARVPTADSSKSSVGSPAFAGAFQGYQWMSPNGYSEPATGTFGNCPAQGPVTGAGYTDTDIGLLKAFHLTEVQVLRVPGRLPECVQQCSVRTPQHQFPQYHFRVDQSLRSPQGTFSSP